MEKNLLTFKGSEQFRKGLLARNLQSYQLTGYFTSNSENVDTETVINFQNTTVTDSPNISETVDGNNNQNVINNTKLNPYGPGGAADIVDVADIINYPNQNSNSSVSLNDGSTFSLNNNQPYWPLTETKMDIVNEISIDTIGVLNSYVSSDNYNSLYFVSDTPLISNKSTKGEYPNFVESEVTIGKILEKSANNTDDSYLAQISTTFLDFQIRANIDRQIYGNTLGRANFQALTNPFSIAELATGQETLIQKNWVITVPDGVFDQAKYLTQQMTGSLLPSSPIEGSYFNEPDNKNATVRQLLDTALTGAYKPADPNNNPSKKFLNNTGSGQKSVLFKSLNYNTFKPDYDTTRTQAGLFFNALFNIDKPSLVNYYVGSDVTDPSKVNSPADDSPVNYLGQQTSSVVYGPTNMAKVYEGTVYQNYQFGLGEKPYDQRPSDDGGFIWASTDTINNAGKKVGEGGEASYGDYDNFIGNGINSYYLNAVSTDKGGFTPGSILDETQRLIDSTPQGKKRLQHAGNAINQISKVFNDGYKEITKGSKVKKYVNKAGVEVGQEYGRLFAKDNPYYTYGNLQQTVSSDSGEAINGNIRKSSYSVLDSTYNLNIAPLAGNGSTNVTKEGSVKKYMFSIENLAWRGTPDWNDLPACEKGPNGGRVMWFPPYDLSFADTTSPQFDSTNFIGRPEPVYTYSNTKRTGTLSWSIIVDHPSVLNLIVDKELAKADSQTVNGVVASFFAGCKRYDLYELAAKFNTLSFTDLTALYQEVLGSTQTSLEEKESAAQGLTPTTNNSQNNSDVITIQTNYKNKGFYFDNEQNPENYYIEYTNYVNDVRKTEYYTSNPTVSAQTSNFFTDVVESDFSILNTFANEIKTIIDEKKGRVVIELQGSKFSNTTNYTEINNIMVDSVINFFKESINLGSTVFDDGTISIKLSTSVLDNVVLSNNVDFSCTEVLTSPNDIYSPNAMACRALRVKNVTVTPFPNNTQQVPAQQQTGLKPQENTDVSNKTSSISKFLIRKLLSECNYFEVIKESDPFVYQSIKEKIKYFNPAFHAITPEGLNSRLTFLNQCTRPGNTIPTKTRDGNVTNNNVVNTSFGKPPVLVLRIGDFYNTKIIPGSIQFSYEGLDINPQGIGVQPMIAKVQMSFDFIGGSGIKEPIEKIQNALSFNYYANTELYDDRAVETEDFTSIDTELFQSITSNPFTTDATQQGELGGTIIGEFVNEVPLYSGNTSGQTQYKAFFGSFIQETHDYFVNTVNFSQDIVSSYNLGILKQLCLTRNYSNGYVNQLQQPNTNFLNIFGKPSLWQTNLEDVSTQFKELINIQEDPIQRVLAFNYEISTEDLDKVTYNFTNIVNNQIQNSFTLISSKIQNYANREASYNQYLRKLDVISFGIDGKKKPDGIPQVLKLTGTTENNENTLTALISDYLVVYSSLTSFNTFCLNQKVIYTAGTENTTFSAITNSLDATEIVTAKSINLMYTLFSDVFLDSNKKQNFKNLLCQNLTSTTSQITTDAISTIVDSYVSRFLSEYTSETAHFTQLINSNQEYKTYYQFNPQRNGLSLSQKTRIFDFSTFEQTDPDKEKISNLYKSINLNDDITSFNDKINFN
jgi:hypothetical protein